MTKSILTGRNILLKTLDKVRESGQSIPALEMTLEKAIPPGTGLGCGSGDAAGLIAYLEAGGVHAAQCASRVGADVPFLLGEGALTLVEGIGEKLCELNDVALDLVAGIVIPSWHCATPEMFGKLDERFAGNWPMNAAQAREEASSLVEKLSMGRKCGMLPNDFAAVLLDQYPDYEIIFTRMSECGALAWGISGSGSAAFGLWPRNGFNGFDIDYPWIDDVLIF